MSTLDSDDGALNVTELLLNVTEHILQRVDELLGEIKEENGEINLDPASLAVTAVIGFVALCFAGLAIVQGLLASGPGRLKCGQYALGPWSKLTVRRPDWSEMRIRTIAYTPVISWESMERSPYQRKRQEKEDEPETENSNDGVPLRRKGLDEFFPATWLALLTLLKVDHPEMWEHKATGADYIPAELSSVPAYGHMQDMINLALIASDGLGRVVDDGESGHFSVLTQKFSLNFRSHPVLGLVGSFETYDPSLSPMRELLSLKSSLEMACGFGRVKQPGRAIQSINWLSDGRSESIHFVRCRCQDTGPALDALSDWIFSNVISLSGDGWEKCFLLANLIRPEWPPAVFPHVAVQLATKVLQPFLLQSNFWLQGGSYYGAIHPQGPNDEVLSWESLQNRTSEMIPEKPLSIDPNVFSRCLEFLALLSKQPEDEEIRSITTKMLLDSDANLIDIQRRLTLQVRMIDDCVSEVDAWNCRAQAMAVVASWTRMAVEVYVYDIPEDEAFPHWPESDWPKHPGGLRAFERYLSHLPPYWHREEVEGALNELNDMWKSSGKIGGIEAKNPLDDLLIYRMIILVMLHTLAIDNSDVANNPEYNRIIPIL